MPDIVDSFENDHAPHARLSKDITIKPCECIHAITYVGCRIMQKPVASNSLVQNPDRRTGFRRDEALRKDVRPAAIPIHCGFRAVRNRVSKRYDCCARSRCRHIETGQEHPGRNFDRI